MSRPDLAIRGGTVVTAERGEHQADVVISGTQILGLLDHGSAVRATKTIDATGKFVLPGLIDPHVHLGYESDDDVLTETRSAAVGGVTTVLSYFRDRGRYLDVWPAVKDSWEQRACVDFAPHFAITDRHHPPEIERCSAEFGIRSFKYYMSFRGSLGREAGFEDVDDALLHATLEAAGAVGALVCVHAENAEIIAPLIAHAKQEGRQDLASYSDARPAFSEAESVARLGFFSRLVNCDVYVAHVSSAAALDQALTQRSLGTSSQMYLETCPQFLTLTSGSNLGAMGKINPPLRGEADVQALWEGVFDGSIDTIGTDHIGWHRDKKSGDLWKAKGSFPGLATLLPLMITEGVHRRGLSLRRLVELVAANPARIFGLSHRKGSLSTGMDADVVIVDTEQEHVVDASKLGSRAEYSPYDGWTLRGWPVATVLRGQVVVENGQWVGQPGNGQYLRREPGERLRHKPAAESGSR